MIVYKTCALESCSTVFGCQSWDKKKYCTRSCSTTANNILYPKRQSADKICTKCGESFNNYRYTLCGSCRDTRSVLNRSIVEVTGNAKYQVNAQLREIARRVYKNSGKGYFCLECNYSTHVDICHIRDLEDFSPETLVGTTCEIENLVALCKNCHWEFDHGILEIQGVLKEYRPSKQGTHNKLG